MVTNAPKERYTGHELDDESGFYYAGARYLDPVMGRWNGVDRLADDYPEWSPYNYAFNNSLRLTDPDGERPCCLPTLVDVRVVASVIGNFFKGANSGLNQRYQTEPSRGATLAGIRDTRAGRISSKTGQPVGEWVVRADKPHGKMTEPHINVNPNATGVPDPHAPISGTTLKALERTGKALDVIGKISKPLAVVADAAQVGGALQQDGGVVGVNTVVATANVAGGWIGAWAGAKGGATLGAGIGSFFPGPGTAIGGFSGGLIGGIGGAFVGSQGAEAVVEEIVEDEDEQ
jgi:RHS repeat-associated protein